ncbi:ParB/RepB/Spo0J family partition protein [Sulfitobacter sp. S0837]|uniref:ParB/RepB/Spo0J family partition protein n=1 Tax=Sulfitobacter maritimus TaxID=2741719 RepID=UPI001581A655|nr:ParB/RepB/Spo0J family partition protein [Sulfitobacter maritimus]NUH63769.1 ParB/RepB/Spo0J family partition protein [Sulfitobacter maritimus]
MARKLFNDVEKDEVAEKASAQPVKRRAPLIRGGAAAPKYIEGSVQSATERTHEDIPVDQIQDSLIEDRIDITEGLNELVESISRNGQQIPIIVRIVNKERPYEIVAGRRRLAAMRRLGKATIRGFITRMSDEEAFVAQGIENSARLETSFIERARTIVKAKEAGFTQENIAEFLGIVQSLVSTMSRIYEMIGDEVVLAIGPARGVGRRNWEKLAKLISTKQLAKQDVVKLVDSTLEDSVARFENLQAKLSKAVSPSKSRAKSVPVRRTALLEGRYAMVRKPRQLVIKAEKDLSDDLLDYISENISDLISNYQKLKGRNDD